MRRAIIDAIVAAALAGAAILAGSWGAHATHAWRAGDVLGQPVHVSAGLITGYRRAPVLPFAAVSMPIAHGRVVAIPGPRCVAIHYAYEIR